MSSTLPTSRALLTDLFSTLAAQPDQTSPSTATPSGPLPLPLKPTLLTLHILFPNELLPALDLLDRNLLTRFVLPNAINADQATNLLVEQQPEPMTPTSHSEKNVAATKTPLYYIRSQNQQSHHQRHIPAENTPTPHYEVRPSAWNCSCPAFAFSAFPASSSPPRNHPDRGVALRDEVVEVEEDWHFGGLSLGSGIPMCKHLLACILVERWKEEFADGVEEREVSIEEVAGWGAGWGG